MTVSDAPRMFISYSWTTPDHEQWVLDLATELRSCGVDVVLDKWELKEGHDKHAFMEKMVTDKTVTKVLMICDRLYAERADGRAGGVGTETQIITPEVYGKAEQSRFVAVVVEKDDEGRVLVPMFYKSRIHIDMTTDELRAANFESLLRWAFDRPLHEKPELGKPPAFLHEAGGRGTKSETLARRTVEAFRNGKAYADGSLVEYLDAVSTAFHGQRLAPSGGEDNFDERVLASADAFLPLRDEFLGVLVAVTLYGDPSKKVEMLRAFFESLVPPLDPGRGTHSFHDWDADNLQLLAQELLLHSIALLLRANWFEAVGTLTSAAYFAGDDHRGSGPLRDVGVFRRHLGSLDQRNARLKLNLISLTADVLKQRCASSPVKFDEVLQADFVLFLADAVIALRDNRAQEWWPDTLVYRTDWVRPFPLFVRATSKRFFETMKCAVGVESKDDVLRVCAAFKDGKLRVPRWQFRSLSPWGLMSLDTLCTRP